MLKKTLMIAALAATVVAAPFAAQAQYRSDPAVGALIGGGIGAAIGHQTGDRNGTLIGGLVGAIAGAAIADSRDDYYYDGRYYDNRYDGGRYYDNRYDGGRYYDRGYVHVQPVPVYSYSYRNYRPAYNVRYDRGYRDGYRHRDGRDYNGYGRR